jgi:hypothetical protein
MGTDAGSYPQVPPFIPLQVKPAVVQVRPEQQGWPSPPQVWQLSAPPAPPPPAQTVPAVVHTLDEQQRSPSLPQETQVSLLLQTTLADVQRLFEQQGSFKPPHRLPPPSGTVPPSTTPDTQAPAAQVKVSRPELGHVAPAAVQVAPPPVVVQQQPPALHRLAEQQACPDPPQT